MRQRNWGEGVLFFDVIALIEANLECRSRPFWRILSGEVETPKILRLESWALRIIDRERGSRNRLCSNEKKPA
jgi:hypothetical protein